MKKPYINKEHLELDSKAHKPYTLDISLLEDILMESGRKYLNVFRVETDDEYVDIGSIYVLSYIKQKVSKEKEIYDDITYVLSDYVSFLNTETKNAITEYKEFLGCDVPYIEDIKEILKHKNKDKWKIITNKYKNKNKELNEKIGKIKEINMTEENTPSYEKGKSVILDITSENWEKYKAGTLFVKEYIKRFKYKEKQIFYKIKDYLKDFTFSNIKKMEGKEAKKIIKEIQSFLKNHKTKDDTEILKLFNKKEFFEDQYKYTNKYGNLNNNLFDYITLFRKEKGSDIKLLENIKKHINKFDTDFFNEYEDFYLCKKGLSKIMSDKHYITYIFYIDKINMTFDYSKLKGFLLSLKDINSINELFLNFELEKINQALKNRFDVGYLDISDEKMEQFKKVLIELNDNRERYDFRTYAEVIAKRLFSLQFSPFRLMIENGKNYYNRKEILKTSKTEDKLDSTFRAEIFNIALQEEIFSEFETGKCLLDEN